MHTGFHIIDYIVLIVYLLAMIGLGIYFSLREDSTDRFFLGNRSMPWWAVGISVFATQLSAITYISLPGRAFETDWSWFLYNMGIPIVGLLIIFVFLPIYRKREITSVYEYLETRFGPETRAYGALAYILMQIGRVAIVMFLPALALSEVTGLPVAWMILLMGVLATIYTVLGGIEVVVWTDVIQTFILVGGAIAALFIIVWGVDGGVSSVVAIGAEHEKFRMFHFDPSESQDLLWFLIIGGLFTNFVPYASDQTVVQRYFTTKSDKEARNCLLLSTWMVIPATFLFFCVGSALFAFYTVHPERLPDAVEWDRVFPHFIVKEMPVGLSGLVIAAIFAGSMSSLDSSLNSISTVCITDFYRRFMNPDGDDRRRLALARWITVIMGIIGTLLAIVVANNLLGNPDQQGAWDLFIAIQGLLGGSLAGIFCAGVFSKKANQIGVVSALVISTAIVAVVKYQFDVHTHLYAAIGILSAWIIAYLFSHLTRQMGRNTSPAPEN